MAAEKRILLVDDSPNDVELVLDALEEERLSELAFVVRDGADALDYLFRRQKFADLKGSLPALILLDLKMPKVDGLEVLRQIKEDVVLKRIPVVMMTSSREEIDVLRSYNLGANSYVVKPINFQEFVTAVKKVGAYWILHNAIPPSG